MQSLVLKWTNYQHISYNGFNYVRIKGNFVITEDENFTMILIQSDDDAIGILISVPKKENNKIENYWKLISIAVSNTKTQSPTQYKEIWLPGFIAENTELNLEKIFLSVKMGDKYITKVKMLN